MRGKVRECKTINVQQNIPALNVWLAIIATVGRFDSCCSKCCSHAGKANRHVSYQPRMDFRLHIESVSSSKYEFIKYLNNSQTTLFQIGHQGYSALLKAHVNIDNIRMYNLKVYPAISRMLSGTRCPETIITSPTYCL
jgi:hypothetical protein